MGLIVMVLVVVAALLVVAGGVWVAVALIVAIRQAQESEAPPAGRAADGDSD